MVLRVIDIIVGVRYTHMQYSRYIQHYRLSRIIAYIMLLMEMFPLAMEGYDFSLPGCKKLEIWVYDVGSMCVRSNMSA